MQNKNGMLKNNINLENFMIFLIKFLKWAAIYKGHNK